MIVAACEKCQKSKVISDNGWCRSCEDELVPWTAQPVIDPTPFDLFANDFEEFGQVPVRMDDIVHLARQDREAEIRFRKYWNSFKASYLTDPENRPITSTPCTPKEYSLGFKNSRKF